MGEINLSNVNRLLTLLLLEKGERHGYEIIEQIEEVTGKRPSSSHIYPFLEKMEEEGLLDEHEEGRRKIYSLTEKGEELASEKLESFGEVIEASILGNIEECENCGCEIYSGGYEKEGKNYCCRACSET